MFQRHFPVGFRMDVRKMIMVAVLTLIEYTAWDCRLTVYGIGTGHIEGNRVKGSKHSYIRDDSCVIFSMAVTVGGDIHDETDVEMRPVL